MKLLKITLVLALIATSTFAQKTPYQEPDFIEITGKAEKEIVPDEIYIELRIDERMEKGRKLTIDQQEAALKKELIAIGVPIKNLSVLDINANISRIGWWREKLLASANYDLKVSDASRLKDVFNSFEKLKIEQANITRATHSKIIELKKQNRIAAIKAAKEKADYLLNAIAQKTGKPLVIRELENSYQPANVTANYLETRNMSYKKSKIVSNQSFKTRNVQFKKIKITSSIYVKFRIQ